MTSPDDLFPTHRYTALVPGVVYPIISRGSNAQINAMISEAGGFPIYLTIGLEEASVEAYVKVEPEENGERQFRGLIPDGGNFANVKGVFTGTSTGTLEVVN